MIIFAHYLPATPTATNANRRGTIRVSNGPAQNLTLVSGMANSFTFAFTDEAQNATWIAPLQLTAVLTNHLNVVVATQPLTVSPTEKNIGVLTLKNMQSVLLPGLYSLAISFTLNGDVYRTRVTGQTLPRFVVSVIV